MNSLSLAAFGAERRGAAVVLFEGLRIEDQFVRNLPGDAQKAIDSVRGFVAGILERHRPEFVILSQPSEKAGNRVHDFLATVRSIAAELGIPIQEVGSKRLMEAYGEPPLKRKEHVRATARTIWPNLNEKSIPLCALDCAAAGLLTQCERLIGRYEAGP